MKLTLLARPVCLTFLFFISIPAMADAGDGGYPTASDSRVLQLENRLAEIKGLDTEALSRGEKRQLRKEVREIRKELAAISGGVYLSVGALILIALLLILLL